MATYVAIGAACFVCGCLCSMGACMWFVKDYTDGIQERQAAKYSDLSLIPATMPVARTPFVARIIKSYWAIESDCPAVMVWARYYATTALMAIDGEIVTKRVSDVESYVKTRFVAAIKELRSRLRYCKDSAYVRSPGTPSMTVKDLASEYDKGASARWAGL